MKNLPTADAAGSLLPSSVSPLVPCELHVVNVLPTEDARCKSRDEKAVYYGVLGGPSCGIDLYCIDSSGKEKKIPVAAIGLLADLKKEHGQIRDREKLKGNEVHNFSNGLILQFDAHGMQRVIHSHLYRSREFLLAGDFIVRVADAETEAVKKVELYFVKSLAELMPIQISNNVLLYKTIEQLFLKETFHASAVSMLEVVMKQESGFSRQLTRGVVDRLLAETEYSGGVLLMPPWSLLEFDKIIMEYIVRPMLGYIRPCTPAGDEISELPILEYKDLLGASHNDFKRVIDAPLPLGLVLDLMHVFLIKVREVLGLCYRQEPMSLVFRPPATEGPLMAFGRQEGGGAAEASTTGDVPVDTRAVRTISFIAPSYNPSDSVSTAQTKTNMSRF